MHADFAIVWEDFIAVWKGRRFWNFHKYFGIFTNIWVNGNISYPTKHYMKARAKHQGFPFQIQNFIGCLWSKVVQLQKGVALLCSVLSGLVSGKFRTAVSHYAQVSADRMRFDCVWSEPASCPVRRPLPLLSYWMKRVCLRVVNPRFHFSFSTKLLPNRIIHVLNNLQSTCK